MVLGCNSRIMVAFALVMSLVGCALLGDWQAIETGDPCSSMGDPGNDTLVSSGALNGTGDSMVNSSMTYLQYRCEERSTSSDLCFWNPQSRITGDICSTCHKACLSWRTSLDFYQFNAAVFLVTAGATLGYVFSLALVSDIVPPGNQVT